MSDPRQYNYVSANNGLQVSIGSYWSTAMTWLQWDASAGETKADALPVDLTNLVFHGNIKINGTDFPLIEVGAIGSTGIRIPDRTNGQIFVQLSQADSQTITEDSIGIYDIRFTDADNLIHVFNKGKQEFKLTASS